MTTLRIILSAILAVAVVMTIGSYVYLDLEAEKAGGLTKLDKARFSYEHAERLMKKGAFDEAVSGFISVANNFPGSEFAEKSLREIAKGYEVRKDQDRAIYYYNRLLADFPDVKDAMDLKAKVENLNIQRMASSRITEDSIEYIVEPGDSLYTIARKFNTTVPMIKKLNSLSGDIIRQGQRLKINISRFSILIDKSKNSLVLSKDGQPFKTYMVATGRNGCTPVGSFTIVDKMVQPPWTNPEGRIITAGSPEYELGERWLGISAQGYGIHGTNDESSIGKYVTAGCVRMYNRDVVELYDIVTNGTEVVIIEGVQAPPAASEDTVTVSQASN